jgi:subtilase family serine protease
MTHKLFIVLVLFISILGLNDSSKANPVFYSRGQFHARVCQPSKSPGIASCHAHIISDAQGNSLKLDRLTMNSRVRLLGPSQAVGSVPYGPKSLSQAYLGNPTQNLNLADSSRLVAIVDAYGYQTLASDIAYYRSYYNLPAIKVNSQSNSGFTTCGLTANLPCLTVKSMGAGSSTSFYRSGAQSGWDQETALDLQMVSALCPKCSILLVQAKSSSLNDLVAAENFAASSGAIVISNSYGATESSGLASYINTLNYGYNWPNIAITVSSGDISNTVDFPASSPTVTAVGGTSLVPANNVRNFVESVWYNSPSSGTGSGCSQYFPMSAWQNNHFTSPQNVCSNRIVADVSASADPNYGVAVYYKGSWYTFGGTSAASPIIAAIYAGAYTMSTHCNSASCNVNQTPYNHPSYLNFIGVGSNGNCGNLLCDATQSINSYNGPTGLGTPHGVTDFAF